MKVNCIQPSVTWCKFFSDSCITRAKIVCMYLPNNAFHFEDVGGQTSHLFGWELRYNFKSELFSVKTRGVPPTLSTASFGPLDAFTQLPILVVWFPIYSLLCQYLPDGIPCLTS